MEYNLEGITFVTLIFGIVFLREYFRRDRVYIAQIGFALLSFAFTIWVWYEEWTKGLLWVELERVIIYSLLFGFIWIIWKIVKRIRNK